MSGLYGYCQQRHNRCFALMSKHKFDATEGFGDEHGRHSFCLDVGGLGDVDDTWARAFLRWNDAEQKRAGDHNAEFYHPWNYQH
ncbi:hypothetical protein PITCH_A1100031 [uncultured Desulfobacterium sp.]|uniref:Uncharacterized protein n=1 Tax=uncultured Desulfobacterium sp. TaxID=201089 RepID=A0A445MR94_9BACT|nr:hypothetical protein PITCH_A1100031 [uncultured Desulfobacterium sp.]